MKVTCPICGEMDLEKHYIDSDQATLIPTVYAPTIEKYLELHIELFGESYEELYGEKPTSERFRKCIGKFSHFSIDDEGSEGVDAHTFIEPIEYWTDN